MLRKIVFVLFVLLPLAVIAQQPPKLEPLPPPPPPPPGAEADSLEAPIRITPGANELIEETVIDGKRIVRVTTAGGAVYYLRDDMPAGVNQGIRIPLWVIKEF
jgi:hypothetical protein